MADTRYALHLLRHCCCKGAVECAGQYEERSSNSVANAMVPIMLSGLFRGKGWGGGREIARGNEKDEREYGVQKTAVSARAIDSFVPFIELV